MTTWSAPARSSLGSELGPGPSDDHQVGPQRAPGQHDVQVVRVRLERGDEDARVLDACLQQHGVVGDVALHGRVRKFRQPSRVAIDHDDPLAGPGDVPRDGSTDPAPAADDHVTAQILDLTLHAADLQCLRR